MSNEIAIYQKDQFEHLIKVAATLAKSKIVPANFQNKPEDCFAAIVMGHELGISPMMAMNAICMIQGAVTLKANTMMAIVRSKAPKNYTKIEMNEKELWVRVTCAINESELATAYVAYWDMNKAKQMGLAHKDNYIKQPITMLKWRALSEALRVVFGDLLLGLNSTEEFQDLSGEIVEPLKITGTEHKNMIEQDFPIPEEEKIVGAKYRIQNGKFRSKQLKDLTIDEIEDYIGDIKSRKTKKDWEIELMSILEQYLNSISERIE